MTTLFITHPSGLLHDNGIGHPERPERLRAIERTLETEAFALLVREQAPIGDLALAQLAHAPSYVSALAQMSPSSGTVQLDGDTFLGPHSLDAALHALGGVRRAVDQVMTRAVGNAFVSMRPPGHHAERATPMGFCLFNTVAVGARYARAAYGAERVAIMDFDVHHGNGTQDIFWSDPSVLYCSTHEMPLYPGTGSSTEKGEHNNICNAPLRAGDGGEAFREAMELLILPRIIDFRPDLIMISAGFDAHRRDPLADLNFSEADFAWVTTKLMNIASRLCGGRLVSVLEGGYDLEGLCRSVSAHVASLMSY